MSMLVQFAAALTGPDVARLKAAYGLRLDRPLPDRTYLEHLSDTTAATVRTDFLVLSVVTVDPAQKLAPTIGAGNAWQAMLFDDADLGGVTAALGMIGAGEIHVIDDREIGGRLSVRFTLGGGSGLTQLAARADVISIEPVPDIAERDVRSAQTMQSGRVEPNDGDPNDDDLAAPMWKHNLHGEDEIIAIYDTGALDINHCFFRDAPPNQPGKNHRKVIADLSPTFAASGHFNFVAGIAAGDDINNLGKHEHRGGAPKAKLVTRNFFDYKLQSLSIRALLTRSQKEGAVIHNFSQGEVVNVAYDTLAADVDGFLWDNEDHVVLAAGGNNFKDPKDTLSTPPATSMNAIGVAAAKGFPAQMSIGSGVPGPTQPDGRRKPDLAAIGSTISSALLDKNDLCATGLSPDAATSWATPNASAAAALVRQYFREGWYPSGEKKPGDGFVPTGALIKATLLNSTVDMTGHPDYPSNVEGWGLIQLDRTLSFSDGTGTRRAVVKDVRRKSGLVMNERRAQFIKVGNGTEQLKVTLVWTAEPPAELKHHQRPSLNVIKLEVTDPNAVTYLGNAFDTAAGVSRPNATGPLDLVNNVQMVVVNNPVPGRWKISLHGFLILGEQGYALVVSGGGVVATP